MRVNRSYLLFIRSLPCLICGDIAEPHHMRRMIPTELKGGTGLKPYDTMCIPLCREHHNDIEEGYEKFEHDYKIDLRERLIYCLAQYIEHLQDKVN